MGSTKACGSHMNLVGLMWILTNQKECVEKCVLEDVLLEGVDFYTENYTIMTLTSTWLALSRHNFFLWVL